MTKKTQSPTPHLGTLGHRELHPAILVPLGCTDCSKRHFAARRRCPNPAHAVARERFSGRSDTKEEDVMLVVGIDGYLWGTAGPKDDEAGR